MFDRTWFWTWRNNSYYLKHILTLVLIWNSLYHRLTIQYLQMGIICIVILGLKSILVCMIYTPMMKIWIVTMFFFFVLITFSLSSFLLFSSNPNHLKSLHSLSVSFQIQMNPLYDPFCWAFLRWIKMEVLRDCYQSLELPHLII